MGQGFRFKGLVIALSLVYPFAVAQATQLPANVQATATSAGITLQNDGSFTFNGTNYVPLLPPGYTPTQQPAGAPVAQADGSIVWGNLQFAPVVQNPGEMPHLPSNCNP